MFTFIKKIFRKEQTREETIQIMRDEERKEYQEKVRSIRLSNLTEEEKKAQRLATTQAHLKQLTILK